MRDSDIKIRQPLLRGIQPLFSLTSQNSQDIQDHTAIAERFSVQESFQSRYKSHKTLLSENGRKSREQTFSDGISQNIFAEVANVLISTL